MRNVRDILVASLKFETSTAPTLWQRFNLPFSLKTLAHSAPRVCIPLSPPVPPKPLPSQPPAWNPLQICDIFLIPPASACRLVSQFLTQTMTEYFYFNMPLPMGFLGGFTYLYDILLHCNRSDLHELAHLFEIQRPLPSDWSAISRVMSPSMDILLCSWKSSSFSSPSVPTYWTRYLQILDSFGPYYGESWITVHLSFSWLLDSFFLSPIRLSHTTRKFRRRWCTMTKLRNGLHARIVPLICYSSPPSPPIPTLSRSPPSFRPITPPPFVLDFEVSVSPYDQLRTPSPCMITLPPVLNLRKRKRRKRKRRMDNYRTPGFVRLPPQRPLIQIPLAVTSVINRHKNRSCGSINTRDPPEHKRCDAYQVSR